jgi:hypothetical protein
MARFMMPVEASAHGRNDCRTSSSPPDWTARMNRFVLICVLLLVYNTASVRANMLDNGVEGTPTVQSSCSESNVYAQFNHIDSQISFGV